MDTCPERLEEYHGTAATHFGAGDGESVRCWVQDIDETWHASMYFEGDRHACACGAILECPVAGVKPDDQLAVARIDQCDDCVAYLDEEESIPDDGGFERASELVTDGGRVKEKETGRVYSPRYIVQSIQRRMYPPITSAIPTTATSKWLPSDSMVTPRNAPISGATHRARISHTSNRDPDADPDVGRDQTDTEFFVFDEDRGAVVAGPFHSKDGAADDAHESIKAASEEFDLTYHTVYHRVRQFGIHESVDHNNNQGTDTSEDAAQRGDECDPSDETEVAGTSEATGIGIEAPTTDLAEADADDAPEGTGDVVDEDEEISAEDVLEAMAALL